MSHSHVTTKTERVVVTTQPSTQSATVTIQGAHVVATRDWHSGLCGCCDDFGGAMYTFCCICCKLCDIGKRTNEHCCALNCTSGVGLVALRTKLRTMYGIQGGICTDTILTACCPLCIVCQMDRELKSMGV
ncbi:placenta-specific gene 8 protein-like [Lineus longissimus]|uniref:placenta-specific gene 8 protein-like n=1 Tax=Lineus longissimus TaxID=88925 RepID=UPI002B4F73CE